MRSPKSNTVSIIVPAYNSQETIHRAIQSVLRQSFADYELIVVDDASDDSTAKIVESYAMLDDRIRLIRLENNSGAGVARSLGLEAATGKYIAFLDADDFWFDGKMEAQVNQLDGGAIICYSSYLRLTINGEYYGVSWAKRKESLKTMLLRNGIGTSSAMFRRDLDGASEMAHLRTRQDYAFWLKLLKNNSGRVVGLKQIYSCYVVGGNSISANPIDNFKSNYKMFFQEVGYSQPVAGILVMCNVVFKITSSMRRYASIARVNRGWTALDSSLLASAKATLVAPVPKQNVRTEMLERDPVT